MKAHYFRVSHDYQKLDRQLKRFYDEGKQIIEGAQRFKEKESGRIPLAIVTGKL